MSILILTNLTVILSSYYLCRIVFAKRSFVDFILGWFLFYLSFIIAVETALGILGKLVPLNIILAHFLIFLILFFLRLHTRYPLPKFPDTAFIYENKIVLFSLSVFLGFFTVKLVLNLINPPQGADSLIYHLSFPVTWLKNANFKNPMVISGYNILHMPADGVPHYYPINAELFLFWLMFPLKNAFLADVGEAPFYFIGILAIYSILRKFNINKPTSLFVGLLWVLIPNCLKQIEQGSYVDIICAALFFMSVNFLLILEEDFRLGNAFIFGLCLGLFIGTKAPNILWFFTLIPFSIYILGKERNRMGLRKIFGSITLILLGFFLLGSYPYIRNYILTGNIFYPIRVTVLGKVLMPGYMDRISFANLIYAPKDFSFSKMLFSEGLGAQFLIFILPATFVSILVLPFIKKFRIGFWRYVLIFIIPAIMLLTYLFYIKIYWSKYLYAYLGIGLVVAAVFLERLRWGKRYIIILGVLSVFSSMAELAGHGELVVSILLSLIIFIFLALNHKHHMKLKTKFKRIIIIIIVIISTGILFFLNHKYDREEYERYILNYEDKEVALGWQWLNDNSGTVASRIAYTGRAEFYPLFGKALKNDVFYVSVNDKPSIPHYYPDGLYRKDKDYFAWKKNLENQKIQYLFIYFPHEYEGNNFPIEDLWAKQHPEKFKLLFSNNKVRIYRLTG